MPCDRSPARSARNVLLSFQLKKKNQNKITDNHLATLCSCLEYAVCCVQHDRIYLQTCTSSRQEAAATAKYRSPSSTALLVSPIIMEYRLPQQYVIYVVLSSLQSISLSLIKGEVCLATDAVKCQKQLFCFPLNKKRKKATLYTKVFKEEG